MLVERLQGLLMILAGCAAMVLIWFAQQNGWLQVRPPTPPGVRPELLPVVTPLSCILPMAAIGALGLCVVGVRRIVMPDAWQPPEHVRDVSRETSPLAPPPRRVRSKSPLRRLLRRLLERSP